MLAAPRLHEPRRSTGIAALGDAPWGTHFCQFYRTAQDLIDLLVPFFVAGLEHNERCVWIASDPLPVPAAREALRSALLNFDDYEARGDIEILDHKTWYERTGAIDGADVLRAWFAREEAALRDGFDGLRLSGNTAFLERPQWAAFAEYEAQVHALFHERKLLALCSYAIDRCGAPELMDVLRNHGCALVRDHGKWTVIRSVTELLAEVGSERSPSTEKAASASRPFHERPASPDEIGPGHEVRFYADDVFPAEQIAHYLAEGLAQGGAAVAVVSGKHLTALRDALTMLGIDLGHAIARGQLRLIEAEPYVASLHEGSALSYERFEQVVPRFLRTALERYPSLRVFGEGVDVLCQQGRCKEAVVLESWWNQLRTAIQFDLLCGYGLSRFSDASHSDELAAVCTQHAKLSSASSSAVDRLLVSHFEQRTRALEAQIQRNRGLETERETLLLAQQKAFEHADAARHHLTRLQRVTAALSESITLEDVCAVLEKELLEALSASAGGVAVFDTVQGELTSFGAPSVRALCAEAYEHDVVSRMPQAQCRRGFPPHDALLEAVALPLLLGQRRLGALAIELSPPRALRVTERALLQDFARQLAFAVDRAVLYESAERARERAEQSSRAKDEFLAMLGHELRNPLAPMLTALQLLELRHPETGKRERAVIGRQLQHMTRLVGDLLEVSRIRRGSFELARERVELAGVLAKAIEMASPLLESRLHHLEFDVCEQDSLLLDADPGRLAQVFANLLTNAAKFTAVGGSIKLRAERREARLVVTVQDQGSGIEPALLPSIFELFVQGPQGLDRAGGGLGIGLWLARTLVELHGGTIDAHSDGLGRGSTFVVDLPALAPASARISSPPTEKVRNARPRALRPLRILVVDDNLDAAESLSDWLREDGHSTQLAVDGPDALRMAEEHKPHIAFLDIGLPVMDGYELAAHLLTRLAGEAPTLVAVTGYGQRADVQRALSAGFAEHVVKPPNMQRLREIIELVQTKQQPLEHAQPA